jgi:phytol kinase
MFSDSLIPFFSTCLIVGAVLLLAEFSKRGGWLSHEFGRKFVHISIGTFVAFWPLILSWPQIIMLSISFIIGISVSRWLNLFQAIHSVQRPTWGEVYFAAAVGLLALVTQDGWIYMAALLHMALADGLAAVIGVSFGKRNKYVVFGHIKSIAGTSTFFAISLGIIAGYMYQSGAAINPFAIAGIALGATVLENASPKGLDNITVPVWVAVALAFV